MLLQRQHQAASLAQEQCSGRAAAADADDHVAAAGELLQPTAAALKLAVDACMEILFTAGLQLPGDAAAAANASAKLQRQGKALQQQLQQAQQQQQQQQQQAFQGQQAEQLAQELLQFGHDICLQLPVPYWCCNPACSNVQECSELELVSRKGSRCSGCATARFCSKSCQQQCWKGSTRQCASASLLRARANSRSSVDSDMQIVVAGVVAGSQVMLLPPVNEASASRTHCTYNCFP
uniref:MYND-type domain-containing protein n=2 Tax=Tetradesmus obliquus TaxID=3088 RepID=A0A383VUG3_TETOB